ncbi:MAG: VOC family protein [Anaerolineales bacterium]|nr:VOC family protein [Anaerolineales bacterium]
MNIQLDMIGIAVRDMAKALAFYRQLGLAIAEGAEQEDHVEVITPNGYRLAWDTVALIKGFDPEWVEPAGHAIGLAFKCDTPAAVDALYAQLTAAGYVGKRAPWDAFWGQRYAGVLDPDGNLIDLFAPLGG